MSDTPRRKPYVWVTWLTGLLAGTDECKWRAWYRAHYEYEKLAEGKDRDAFFKTWTAKHDAMTEKRAQILRDLGFIVRVENANKFTLEGKTITLSGKPDIVALPPSNDDPVLVIDEKSGKRRPSDVYQVDLYLFALPRTWLPNRRINGQLEYPDGQTPVTYDEGTQLRIIEMLQFLGRDEEPPKTPSANECRFCDVLNCDSRYEESSHETEEF